MKALADIAALLAIRALIFPVQALPEKIAFRLARCYVSIIFLVMSRLDGVARRNLEIVFPDKSEDERDAIRKESKNVLASNILGFARIPTFSKEEAQRRCDYKHAAAEMERLRERSGGCGILLPTIHFDAFEFFIQAHALNYRPVSILGRGFGLKRLDRFWNGRREFHGNQIFSRKGGYKEIVRRLKAGEDVVIMCDQNVKSSHAMFVDFFGVPAATTKTVALAALRVGAPILFGSYIASESDTFEVSAQEILHPTEVEGSTEEKLLGCMNDLHRRFEQQILKRPEAWFWIHRRWKTRPNGEPETMYD